MSSLWTIAARPWAISNSRIPTSPDKQGTLYPRPQAVADEGRVGGEGQDVLARTRRRLAAAELVAGLARPHRHAPSLAALLAARALAERQRARCADVADLAAPRRPREHLELARHRAAVLDEDGVVGAVGDAHDQAVAAGAATVRVPRVLVGADDAAAVLGVEHVVDRRATPRRVDDLVGEVAHELPHRSARRVARRDDRPVGDRDADVGHQSIVR